MADGPFRPTRPERDPNDLTPRPHWTKWAADLYRAFLPALPSDLDDQELWKLMALLEPAPAGEGEPDELEEALMPEGRPLPTEEEMRDRVGRYLSRRPAALANLNVQRAKLGLEPFAP